MSGLGSNKICLVVKIDGVSLHKPSKTQLMLLVIGNQKILMYIYMILLMRMVLLMTAKSIPLRLRHLFLIQQ